MDKKFSFIIALFIFQVSAVLAADAGFNEICRIYTEALNSSMSNEQKNDYINDNVAKRINEKDAVTTHSIIYQVTPSERYSIFKESAETSLKKSWNCSAMKALMK